MSDDAPETNSKRVFRQPGRMITLDEIRAELMAPVSTHRAFRGDTPHPTGSRDGKMDTRAASSSNDTPAKTIPAKTGRDQD